MVATRLSECENNPQVAIKNGRKAIVSCYETHLNAAADRSCQLGGDSAPAVAHRPRRALPVGRVQLRLPVSLVCPVRQRKPQLLHRRSSRIFAWQHSTPRPHRGHAHRLRHPYREAGTRGIRDAARTPGSCHPGVPTQQSTSRKGASAAARSLSGVRNCFRHVGCMS